MVMGYIQALSLLGHWFESSLGWHWAKNFYQVITILVKFSLDPMCS